jgi:hypothetical protein
MADSGGEWNVLEVETGLFLAQLFSVSFIVSSLESHSGFELYSRPLELVA